MQNEIISIIGIHLQEQIVSEIKQAGVFAVSADESADTSRTKQPAVLLRYVNDKQRIVEAFLGFVGCSSTTGVTGCEDSGLC